MNGDGDPSGGREQAIPVLQGGEASAAPSGKNKPIVWLPVVIEGQEALHRAEVLLRGAHRFVRDDADPGATFVDAASFEGRRLLVEALVCLVESLDVWVVRGLLPAAELQSDAELVEQRAEVFANVDRAVVGADRGRGDSRGPVLPPDREVRLGDTAPGRSGQDCR